MPRKYINTVQDMHEEIRTYVRTCEATITNFLHLISLYQSFALSFICL